MTTSELNSYDNIIVAFSGGKDSLACLLYLLELGVNKNQIELWHYDVDGNSERFMDWPITTDYCLKVATALEVPIRFAWKVGGFKGEMLRENSLTQPTCFEDHLGEIIQVGGVRGKKNTRMKFPQVAADLSARWCSAYLKIDVCSIALNNQSRFNNSKTLFITGERAEESPGRAKYKTFQIDKSDRRFGKKKRHIDQWRPVHSWPEKQVWAIIRKYNINPHPAYKLGWGRVSCASCIFGSKDQWASLNKIAPGHVDRIVYYEKLFKRTINRKKSIPELILDGTPYIQTKNTEFVSQALSEKYTEPVILDKWEMPAGAFGDSCGPV